MKFRAPASKLEAFESGFEEESQKESSHDNHVHASQCWLTGEAHSTLCFCWLLELHGEWWVEWNGSTDTRVDAVSPDPRAAWGLKSRLCAPRGPQGKRNAEEPAERRPRNLAPAPHIFPGSAWMCMQTRGARWPECRGQRGRLRPSGAHQPFSPDSTSCFSIAASSCFTRPAFLSTVSHVTAATCGSSIFAYCAPLPTMQDTIFWSWVSRGQPRAPALALVARMIHSFKPIGTWTRVKACYGSKPTTVAPIFGHALAPWPSSRVRNGLSLQPKSPNWWMEPDENTHYSFVPPPFQITSHSDFFIYIYIHSKSYVDMTYI